MIYILTGKIRSGKTTALLEWVKDRKNVDGLLCPDDDNGKRYILKIKSKKELEIEIDNKPEEIIAIGNFRFLKSAFNEANDYLMSIAYNSETSEENKYLIIDEIGKLELKNKGLHAAAEKMIPDFMTNETQHIILVVRDYLLEAVLRHYSISEYEILNKADLELLH